MCGKRWVKVPGVFPEELSNWLTLPKTPFKSYDGKLLV